MTSVERPSYATIVKQTVARFRDRNIISDKYAEIEYNEGFNQLKLKPAAVPNTGRLAASVSIEQSGGADPNLNFYNTVTDKIGNIGLINGTFTADANLEILRGDNSSPNASIKLTNSPGVFGTIEYSPGFNQLKLKPKADTDGSVSIEQAGGGVPTLNFYNSFGSFDDTKFMNIRLNGDGRLLTDKNIKIGDLGYTGTSTGELECKSVKFVNATVAAGGALPASATGYLTLSINGVLRNIPFF